MEAIKNFILFKKKKIFPGKWYANEEEVYYKEIFIKEINREIRVNYIWSLFRKPSCNETII